MAKAAEKSEEPTEVESASEPPPLTLWQKIAKAMELVGYVQKRGKNQFHKYSYATAADVAEKAREAFLEVGLLFLPTMRTVEMREKHKEKGGITYIAQVTMDYRVMDVETPIVESRASTPSGTRDQAGFSDAWPPSYTFKMVGEGQDEGDKAVYKAITGCHKYALMQLLMISTGDDPEADVKTDEAKPVEPTIGEDQQTILESLMETHGTDAVKMLAYFHVEKLSDLTVKNYERACALIEKRTK